MIFKRAVYEARRRPKLMFRIKTKSTLKDIPNVPWPRTPTERMLVGLFDCSAGQFLGILEALWDSTTRPLQMKMPDDPELVEVFLELLSAGITILSGVTSTEEKKCEDRPCLSPIVLTPTSNLLDLAVAGENKIPIISAVRFIKLLFQYKQLDTFGELAREMLQVLPSVEGLTFRKPERELTLLYNYKLLLSSQRNIPLEDNMNGDRHKSSFSISDELTTLVDNLYKSVCGCTYEMQPDGDLVVDIVLFLWGKVKVMLQRDQLQTHITHDSKKVDNYDTWVWCLTMLCEVAWACDLANVDCITTAEMFLTLGIVLESAAVHERDQDDVKLSSFSLLESSGTEVLQKVCEVVNRGQEALAKGVATLLPQDCSALTNSAVIQKFHPLAASTCPSASVERNEEDESGKEKEELEGRAELDSVSNSRHTQSTYMFLLAKDLYQELDIIHHRASLKLLQMNAVSESELLDRIKRNRVSKALFLIQKALLVYNDMGPNDSSQTESLLEEASILLEKAGIEERKMYMSTSSRIEVENRGMKEGEVNPPPPPILMSHEAHSFTFATAPYNSKEQVCWYQLCGRVAEGITQKVRLGDCSLPGTGDMVPAVSGDCVLRVTGLEPNLKYVFAVAAYNNQGKLLGNTIGRSTLPLLTCMSVPLLSAWASLAEVAFQMEQYAIAKRACRELWSHFTYPNCESCGTQDRHTTTGLHKETLQYYSPYLCQLFHTSIFIETEINIQQRSLCCHSISDNGPFVWEQEARLAECERMLVAMDSAMCLNDGSAAVQSVVSCYSLLAPLIFYQIPCEPVVQVLKKCLIVLEVNSTLLKQRWTGRIAKSLMHMVACITYYLSKALHVLHNHQMAAAVMDCGHRLLQEVSDAQRQVGRLSNQTKSCKTVAQAAVKRETDLLLKALYRTNKKRTLSEAATATDNEISRPLTGCEDPNLLFDLIASSTLKDAYQCVMKFRGKPFFIEYAALLLQRTMDDGHPDLVINWGQSMFHYLSRRDEVIGQSGKYVEGNNHSKRKGSVHTLKGNELPQKKNTHSQDEARKKLKQKTPTNRELQIMENLLNKMSAVVQCYKKRRQLRNMSHEERLWRSHLNYITAQAHLTILHQGLDQLHGEALQQRYSQCNPLCFSLAYSGVLVWRNLQQQHLFKYEVALERDSSLKIHVMAARKAKNQTKAVQIDDSVTEDSFEDEEDSSQPVEQQMETQRGTAALLLYSLNKATLHLRRAMVLAHRGSHWTTLQYLCQTMWDQSCRITLLVQRTAQIETPSALTAGQLHSIFTPLLLLATDLCMDMLNKLGLWSLYDNDLSEEKLESRLHYSAPLDDSTHVDLRWIRTLVFHTLERLHDSGKWENLAHLAILFNSYTRERYALIVTPLLVHAQRRLLERISYFGGPAVPQPHHVKTQKITGQEVTYKSYAGSHMLSAWTAQQGQQPIHRKTALMTSIHQETNELKGAEMQRSMSLVCVPLDVEDTLTCHRQALEKRPYCLQIFQHSRSLLVLLLAHTQPRFVTQLQYSQNRGHSHSESLVDFSPLVMSPPNLQPSDMKEEDYSTPNAIYGIPISPENMPRVAAAYSTTIKYLQANSHDSLRVLALHEMGNLQFYNGNTRAAHSSWKKAVDCALQTSEVLKKWDGMSIEGGSLQQTLKQAGTWGCLQAAVLTAKIAQYILSFDISKRTKSCLLSAHLFKCVLYCSMAQPQIDLEYASHNIRDELLLGVDLFSEPQRLQLSTTVTSLTFICHWLFSSGYYITLLPILALYLHFVGTVCRDVQRTVGGKILKIRVLTELHLYTEAVKETVELTQGSGVFFPYGQYITKANPQPVKTFYSNKSLLDNVEALEELVNCDFTPEVRTLYGLTLCVRFNLARIQLFLALSDTVHGLPAPGEACGSVTNSLVKSKQHEQDSSYPKTDGPKVFIVDIEKESLTPECVKLLLLEEASFLLHSISQQLTSLSCNNMEDLELRVESNLLKANLYLQQGHATLSSEMAVSSLVLLQTLAFNDTKGCSEENTLDGDCPRAVEAFERIGVSLWLRCRLALVHSLAAHIRDSAALFPGKNLNEVAAQVLQEAIDECVLWGDVDYQALFMLKCAELEALRGKTDDCMAMLQEAVSLLSGRTCMPPGSHVTLIRATLMLSDLRGEQDTILLQLAQKLLKKQLDVFGESVVLIDGKICFSPPGPRNIYLPFFNILNQNTSQIGTVRDLWSSGSPPNPCDDR
ncbi:cilia- and flagella-associated protein 54-like isoform X2 [Mugil cephalus]|uniref:cilia- and flagella-associated protein 54-like isoform X2 n=1 Tax=Mugil cephalus TaxID=48193 RepID=UPI001FB692B5|nr:cilia- and flagella-associated protein 54-like isoform X2 [Mugil cephalus]